MARFPGKFDPKAPPPTDNQAKPVSQKTLVKRAQLQRQEHRRTFSNADTVNLKKPGKPVKSETPTKPKKSPVPAKPAEPPPTPKPSMVMSAPSMVQGSKAHMTTPANPLFGEARRNWELRGMQAMSAFLDTLEGPDQRAMMDAFYGTSSGTGLRETIREVTDKTNHSDLAELDNWIDHTLADRSRQSVVAILESITENFGGTGRLFNAVQDRLIRKARSLLKDEAHWQDRFDERGLAQTLDVVAALQDGRISKLKSAFFDPGFQTPQYGKNPRLYETIRERIGDGNDPSQERASFDRWAGQALQGYSPEDLHTIYETLLVNQREKVCTGGVFAEVDAALRRNIVERISSDQFVQTVLKNGDVGEAADDFSAAVRQSTLVDTEAMHGRMSALLAADLAKLPTIAIARLKEKCADLPAYRGMTALRFCLGMGDPKAVDKLFLELAKDDRSDAGMARLRAVYRLAEDQLATETGKETEIRIRAALQDLTAQETILIATRRQELAFGGNLHELLVTHLCSAVSADAPRYFVNEYLNYGRTPFEVLALLQGVVFSFVGLNSNSIGQVNAALANAIRAALGDLTEQELGDLARLDFSPAGKEVAVAFDNQIQARIGELKDKLANKYLMPEPLNLKPPKN